MLEKEGQIDMRHAAGMADRKLRETDPRSGQARERIESRGQLYNVM